MEAMKDSESIMTTKGSTRSPCESSVYSLSIVLLDPPAPAARAELGFWVVWLVARRRTCPAPGGREIVLPDPGRGGWPVGADTGESGRLESDIFVEEKERRRCGGKVRVC